MDGCSVYGFCLGCVDRIIWHMRQYAYLRHICNLIAVPAERMNFIVVSEFYMRPYFIFYNNRNRYPILGGRYLLARRCLATNVNNEISRDATV